MTIHGNERPGVPPPTFPKKKINMNNISIDIRLFEKSPKTKP